MAIKIRKKVEKDKEQVAETLLETPEGEVVVAGEDIPTSGSLHQWVIGHAKLIFGVMAVLVISLIVISVYTHFKESDRMKMSDDLLEAVYAYEAPAKAQADAFVAQQQADLTRNPRPNATILTYSNPAPSETARNSAIVAHIEQFLKTYPNTKLRQLAELMSGGCSVRLGKIQQAESFYVGAKDGKNADPKLDLFSAQGRISTMLDLGQYDQAIKVMQDEVRSDARPHAYKAAVLRQMAMVYEGTDRMDKAVDTYVTLAALYVGTREASYAKSRLDILIDNASERIKAATALPTSK